MEGSHDMGGYIPPRVAVFGAGGFVGSNLVEQLERMGVDAVPVYRYGHEVPAGATRCELTDSVDVGCVLDHIRPKAVINAAGKKFAWACEECPTEAFNKNVVAAGTLAGACKDRSIPFVHLSTNHIFRCDRGPYSENDKPDPQNTYAKSKLAGEYVVQKECPDALIIRAGCIYGKHTPIFRWLHDELANGKPIYGYLESYLSPTWVGDLANGIMSCLRQRLTGFVHVTGGEVWSRYDFLWQVARRFGWDESLIKPTPLDLAAHWHLTRDCSLTSVRIPTYRGLLDGLAQMEGWE